MTHPLIKIFSQLYVGFQPRTRYTGDSVNGENAYSPVKLAFVTPYENNAAGKKRMDSVDRWAVPTGTWVPKADGSGQEYIRKPKDEEFKSVIIENVPTAGFKLAEDIRRTYWGGGNVVWRIESPLGWEFEISSSNLARIITDCGIAAGGEILGRCIFGRMGKDNLLIPEGSELWKESVKDAETIDALSKTVSANSVVAGSICTMKTGETMTYMGRFYVTMLIGNGFQDSGWLRYSLSSEAELNFRDTQTFDVLTERYHVFKNNGSHTNFYYGKDSYTLYKEKRVVSVSGTDPECTDQKKNEAALNSVQARCNFASVTKSDSAVDSFVFSIESPVSSKCVTTRLDADYVKTIMHCGKYSWAHILTRMNTNEKCVESDCTVFLDSGEIVNSMKMYGTFHPTNSTKRWGPEVKVLFDKRVIVREDGTIIVGANRLDNKDLMIKGSRHTKIVPFRGDTETNEIVQTQVDGFLKDTSSYNLLTFEVTLPSGEVLSSQVTI